MERDIQIQRILALVRGIEPQSDLCPVYHWVGPGQPDCALFEGNGSVPTGWEQTGTKQFIPGFAFYYWPLSKKDEAWIADIMAGVNEFQDRIN